MGVIYKARKQGSAELVAVKMLLPAHRDSEEAVARFAREIQAIAAIEHPNVMPIHDTCLDGGVPFFSMDLAVGGSLADLLPKFHGRWRQVAQLMVKVAQAVQYAHEHGVLHRDLKPGNILFTAELEPLVSDFGLAKWLDDSTEDLTRSLIMFGTPSYVAPEQAEGRNKELTPATDVYSLGAILFEVLTGRPPFVGDNPLQVLQQALTARPPAPRTLLPMVPHDLEVICLRCLEKDPQHRYPSAGAFAGDLDRWLGGEPVSARRSGGVPRFGRRATATTSIIAAIGLAVFFARILVTGHNLPPGGSPQRSSPTLAMVDVPSVSTQFLDEEAFSAPANARFRKAVAQTFGEKALYEVLPPPAYSEQKARDGSPDGLLEHPSKSDSKVSICESFRVVDGHLRVVSRLVQTNAGTTIYGQTDLLPLDGSVSEFVALLTRLKTAFADQVRTTSSQAGAPLNVEAERFCHRAQEFYERRTRKDNEIAITLYQHALQIDPKHAGAWAGCSRAYDAMFHAWGGDNHSLELARTAAHHALELDPYSAEAHAALGACLFSQDQYREAREQFLQALEIDPRRVGANAYVCICEREMGQPGKALSWIIRAIQLDHNHGSSYAIAAETYMLLGDDRLAEQAFEQYLELIPDPVEQTGPVVLLLWQKRYSEAKRMLADIATRFPDSQFLPVLAAETSFFAGESEEALKRYNELAAAGSYSTKWQFFGAVNPLSAVACILMSRGEPDQAQRKLAEAKIVDEQILAQHPNNPRILHDLAAVECLKGNPSGALKLLAAAISAGWVEHRSTLIDPRFQAMREDAQFKQLVAQTFPAHVKSQGPMTE